MSCLHLAAAVGDLQLCRLVISRGVLPNNNIFIPNDQGSWDDSPTASNGDDGSDFSQYRWGLITPMRLARSFKHCDVCTYLQKNGGTIGREVVAHKRSSMLYGLIGFTITEYVLLSLYPNSCWVSEDRTKIMFKNTYMNGDRIYPDILFDTDLCSSMQGLLDSEWDLSYCYAHIIVDPVELR
mmetsp:Transcript_14818/g.32188  ORF Transcript_14818/g.32188 Transcript_14818/m.32188 type:complete len:182 (-) Transcript_14818:176-721(-)